MLKNPCGPDRKEGLRKTKCRSATQVSQEVPKTDKCSARLPLPELLMQMKTASRRKLWGQLNRRFQHLRFYVTS